MGKENSIYPVRLVLYMSLAFLLKASSFKLSTSTLAVKERLEKRVLAPSFFLNTRSNWNTFLQLNVLSFEKFCKS